MGSNTVSNPTAVIDGYTVFTVKVSDLTFDDCFVTGRVAVDLSKLDVNTANAFVCEDEFVILEITLTGGEGAPTIVWSPSDNITAGQGTTKITVIGVNDEVYTVDVAFNNGCTISGTATLDVGTFGGAVIATISADSIYDAETVQLHAEPSGLMYSWSPTEGLDDPTSQNPIFTPPNGPGNYSWTVSITQEDQCVKTSSVDLVVRETRCDPKYVFLPNALASSLVAPILVQRMFDAAIAYETNPLTFQLSVQIQNDWNLVSVPGLHPSNQNVSTWWINKDPLSSVFRYNGTYQSVTSVSPGIGYYMKHSGLQVYNTGDEWPVGGIQLVAHDPIPITAGWNMIGLSLIHI